MTKSRCRRPILVCVAAALLCALAPSGAVAKDRFITLASTTSTENSGLFGYLLPLFEAQSGISVRLIVKGTGQAIEIARRGDADVLFVHHPPSEKAFVAAGWGVERHEVMYNDFVIVGPGNDPAAIGGGHDAVTALQLIARVRALFLSRGDDSGTHRRELALWRSAGVDVAGASGTWYREAGAGMGAALNIAAEAGAYVLADRGSWVAFSNKRGLELLIEGDDRLVNLYSVILVNPSRHPHVKARDGQALIDWLLSDGGRAAIAAFNIDGEQLFFPVDRD